MRKLTAGLAALEWAAQYDKLETVRVDGGKSVGVWLLVTFPEGGISYFPPLHGEPIHSILSVEPLNPHAGSDLVERAASVVEVYRALEARAATVRPCDCGGIIHADGKGRYDKTCADCIEASERDNAERRKQGGANWRDGDLQ